MTPMTPVKIMSHPSQPPGRRCSDHVYFATSDRPSHDDSSVTAAISPRVTRRLALLFTYALPVNASKKLRTTNSAVMLFRTSVIPKVVMNVLESFELVLEDSMSGGDIPIRRSLEFCHVQSQSMSQSNCEGARGLKSPREGAFFLFLYMEGLLSAAIFGIADY